MSLRYKPPTDSTSRLLRHVVRDRVATPSTELRFASAVAGFGMLLRDSPHRGTVSYELVRELALAGRGRDAEGHRARFLELVDAAERLTRVVAAEGGERR